MLSAEVFCFFAMIATAIAATDNTNITYISGTCKKAAANFSLDKYYNQEAMRVWDFAGKDLSSSSWDLGKDGAFVGFRVMYCEPGSTSSSSPEIITLLKAKGFDVVISCDAAGRLKFPTVNVFTVMDTTPNLYFSNADVTAINAFYIAGGGIYGMTDDCTYFQNVNKMFQGLPLVLRKFQVHYNDAISPHYMKYGNPIVPDEFGSHVVFTGVAQMNSGVSLSVPTFNGQLGTGVFAPLATAKIGATVYACSSYGETSPGYVASHAVQMYLDPPVQLVNESNTTLWGRIMVDTGWTRYYPGYGSRTTTFRFFANVVVWLLNIEKIMFQNQTNAENQTQVLGCSNGDALTLKGPSMMCRVGFVGNTGNVPKCLALIVTEQDGTTCVVDVANGTLGTYWIMVDGKNSSLQFSVTAASLTPRGTVTAVTGTCRLITSTSIAGCTDGSSFTVDWTLPYPTTMTLGLGSSASICSSFTVNVALVTCVLKGINKLPRGRYQTYINQVATGIPLSIESDIPSLNHALCSRTHSLSPLSSNERSVTGTVTATLVVTESRSLVPTGSPTLSASAGPTLTSTLWATLSTTKQFSGSVTETSEMSATDTVAMVSPTGHATVTQTATETRTESREVTRTKTNATRGRTRTWTELVSVSGVVSGTRRMATSTESLGVSGSETWGCVDGRQLEQALGGVTMQTMFASESQVRDGFNSTLAINVGPGVLENGLHVPWFESFTLRAYLHGLTVPNELGYVKYEGYATDIEVQFPSGLQSQNTSEPTEVIVRMPPLADYVIYAPEVVELQLSIASFTLGRLCGANSLSPNATSAPSTSPIVTFAVLYVDYAPGLVMSAAQSTLVPMAIVGSLVSPFAAPDLQSMIMIAMMPCSSSYQRRSFAMFRALSVFTIDSSYEGILWGNLMANLAAFVAHACVVVGISLYKKVTLAEATVPARFPGLYLQLMWQLTYASNAFAGLQLLASDEGGVGASSKALGALMFAGFCVAIPVVTLLVVYCTVSAYYNVYEFHKWRRGETNLRVRLLSTVLLPVGRWEPADVRRRLGTFLTIQCRAEYHWMLLPTYSPLVISILGAIQYQSERACLAIYGTLVALHLLLLALIVFFKPLRSMLEDWFACLAYVLTTMFLLCSAINVANPRSVVTERILAVVMVLQVVLLVVRLLYHVAHVFIARRLSDVVPHRMLFEWNCGRATVEEDDEMENVSSVMRKANPLYDDLEALMLQRDDDNAPLPDVEREPFAFGEVSEGLRGTEKTARVVDDESADAYLSALLAGAHEPSEANAFFLPLAGS